jgi:O-antigen biosynthesis protein
VSLRILLMGFYGRRNFGDDLMAATLARFLQENLAAHVYIVADEAYFSQSVLEAGATRVPRRVGAVLSALRHCDILVQGGGTVFHDSYVGRALLRYWRNLTLWLFVFVVARMFGAKVLLLGAGIGPIRHRVTRLLCRLALSCADGVMVRDRASGEAVRDLAIGTPMHPGCDVSAVLQSRATPVKPERKPQLVIGIAPCALDPFSKDCHLVTHYWLELADALGEFASKTDARVRLFALFTGYAVPSDEGTCRAMAARLPHCVDRRISLYPDNMKTTLEELSECDVVISARYHGLMAAFMTGCRIAAVTYHRKVGDLARSLGLDEDCIISADCLMSRQFWLVKLEWLAQGSGQPKLVPADLADVARSALTRTLDQLRDA